MNTNIGLPWIVLFMSIAAFLISKLYFKASREREKLRIRADLLKAGIDPDRLDKEGEDE